MADDFSKDDSSVSLGSIDKKLAVLCERVSNSIDFNKRYTKKLDTHIGQADKRLIAIEKCQEGLIEKQADNKDEINRLRSKSNVIDIILASATTILGALGLNDK